MEQKRRQRRNVGPPTGIVLPGRLDAVPLTDEELERLSAAAGLDLFKFKDELSGLIHSASAHDLADKILPKSRAVAAELLKIAEEISKFSDRLSAMMLSALEDQVRGVATDNPRTVAVYELMSRAKDENGAFSYIEAIGITSTLSMSAEAIAAELEEEAEFHRAGPSLPIGALATLVGILERAGVRLSLPGSSAYIDRSYPLIDVAETFLAALAVRLADPAPTTSRSALAKALREAKALYAENERENGRD